MCTQTRKTYASHNLAMSNVAIGCEPLQTCILKGRNRRAPRIQPYGPPNTALNQRSNHYKHMFLLLNSKDISRVLRRTKPFGKRALQGTLHKKYVISRPKLKSLERASSALVIRS